MPCNTAKQFFQKQSYELPGHLQIPRKCSSNKMFIALIPSECDSPIYVVLWFMAGHYWLTLLFPSKRKQICLWQTKLTGQNHHSELQTAATLKKLVLLFAQAKKMPSTCAVPRGCGQDWVTISSNRSGSTPHVFIFSLERQCCPCMVMPHPAHPT